MIMAVIGIVAILTGKFQVTRTRMVRDAPARYLGLICLLPFPFSVGIGFLIGLMIGSLGMTVTPEAAKLLGWAIDIAVLVLFVCLIRSLGQRLSEPTPADEGAVDRDGLGDLGPAVGACPAPAESDVWLPFDEAVAPRRPGRLIALVGVLVSLLAGLALFLATRPDPNAPANDPAPPPVAFAPVPVPIPAANLDPAPGFGPARAPVPAPAPAPDRAPIEPPRPMGPREPLRGPIAGRAGRTAPKRNGPAAPMPIRTEPVASDRALGSPPRVVGDAKVTDLAIDAARMPPAPAWLDGGRAFAVVERGGTLRRVALDGFREERRWEIGKTCSDLAVSAEGLVLAVEGLGEVWTLDPATLAVRSRIATGDVKRAASAPSLGIAFVTGRNPDEVAVVDLKAGAVARTYDARSFPGAHAGFKNLAVAPDGRAAFAEGMERLIRFRIAGDELVFEEASPRIAQNGRAVVLSPDGSRVALPSGGGNYEEAPYTTVVYRAEDLTTPEYRVTSGAYPQALGFDPVRPLVYAQNFEHALLVFEAGGSKQATYDLGRRGESSRYFTVHPAGGKLFALSDSTLRFVEPGLAGSIPAEAVADADEPPTPPKAKAKARMPRPRPAAPPG